MSFEESLRVTLREENVIRQLRYFTGGGVAFREASATDDRGSDLAKSN